jgi:hypothetical protein
MEIDTIQQKPKRYFKKKEYSGHKPMIETQLKWIKEGKGI